MIRQHKYKMTKAHSNISFIASLDPLEDLNIDELAEFLLWQRPRTGLTAEQFYQQPRAFKLGTFLRWCSDIAFDGAYICVKLLSIHPLVSSDSEKNLTVSDCQKTSK